MDLDQIYEKYGGQRGLFVVSVRKLAAVAAALATLVLGSPLGTAGENVPFTNPRYGWTYVEKEGIGTSHLVRNTDEGQWDASGRWRYVMLEGIGAMIRECAEPSGDIMIPSELDGNAVTVIGYEAFAECNVITGVVVPDSVRIIEDRAFAYCGSLIVSGK